MVDLLLDQFINQEEVVELVEQDKRLNLHLLVEQEG